MTTIISKYPGVCKRCGGSIPAGVRVLWERGYGVRHESTDICEAAKIAVPSLPPAVHMDAAEIVKFLQNAHASGLKFPKARFLSPDQREMRLSLAGLGSKAAGAIQVKIEHEWIGRICSDGRVEGPLASRPDVLACIALVAKDPAAAARAYGALMCRCSFCNLPLTDAGSVTAGYGPICASKWGLPWGRGGVPDLKMLPAEATFASVAQETEAIARTREEFTEEASTLGISTTWPREVDFGGRTFTNGVVKRSSEGDLLGVEYVAFDGSTLLVVND